MIVVTGATGQLGRLVVDGLLKQVPAEQVTVAVRDEAKAADLAERGVRVRVADYNDPQSLERAFQGADKLLLISGSEVGKRVAQHTAAAQAAKTAGVRHVVYTSVLQADTSSVGLAAEHLASEQAIRGTGLPFTFLRNGWYTENYAQTIAQGAESGAFIGSAGKGRVASAARADYAEAAVAVLTGTGHEGKVYELSGDTTWDFDELATVLTGLTGREVVYQDLSPEQHRAALIGAGLPEQIADLLLDFDRTVSVGDLGATPGHLRELIGHATTPLDETVAAILKG
ncbi:SDR family oxidoreductase [Kutzneria albida]|uniref:Quinone oxidoreductase 2 n=1 Tax=Kutzneria albida DSM 43870 TaxID=1449976 RepID=W5W6X6_9PSEU|nr:SDR family oxidoreductase [Kutzneria albida]AHH96515.1 Quinone oxidoreductase 2 [Kutzneria albida DSM 43870]